MAEKWSRNVHPHEGALRRFGWSEGASEEVRRRAVRESVYQDGYATTVSRLDYLANVNKHHDKRLAEVARSDLEWVEKWEAERPGSGLETEDRPRRRGRTHEVEAYDKADGEHVKRHRADNPRRRA